MSLSFKEFRFIIPHLPSSFSVLGLKYISSSMDKDSSTIFVNAKFLSENNFVKESKNFFDYFFKMFFNTYPELRVYYNELSFSYNNEIIKDYESVEDIFNKSSSIQVNFI